MAAKKMKCGWCKTKQDKELVKMGRFIILEYCPVLIFRLVLYSIHLIISFATGLKRFLTYLKRCYVAANMGLSNLQRCTKNDIDAVQCFAREVTKLPKHLSIILMNYEDTCIEDLSNIAVWSFAVGVQYVSFYEKIGEALILFFKPTWIFPKCAPKSVAFKTITNCFSIAFR